jgi:YlmC/YmxH family sporulation protein
MELSFSELKKRDVINVPDGRCLGKLTDLTLSFPKGELAGIIVPGRKHKGLMGLFKCLDKSEVYISVDRIIKIGGDVILVDITSVRPNPPPPPKKPCPSPCKERKDTECDFTIFPETDGRIDTSDY